MEVKDEILVQCSELVGAMDLQFTLQIPDLDKLQPLELNDKHTDIMSNSKLDNNQHTQSLILGEL